MNQPTAADRLEMAAMSAEAIGNLLNFYATAIETGDGVKQDPEIAAWLSSRADQYLHSAWRDRGTARLMRAVAES